MTLFFVPNCAPFSGRQNAAAGVLRKPCPGMSPGGLTPGNVHSNFASLAALGSSPATPAAAAPPVPLPDAASQPLAVFLCTSTADGRSGPQDLHQRKADAESIAQAIQRPGDAAQASRVSVRIFINGEAVADGDSSVASAPARVARTPSPPQRPPSSVPTFPHHYADEPGR